MIIRLEAECWTLNSQPCYSGWSRVLDLGTPTATFAVQDHAVICILHHNRQSLTIFGPKLHFPFVRGRSRHIRSPEMMAEPCPLADWHARGPVAIPGPAAALSRRTSCPLPSTAAPQVFAHLPHARVMPTALPLSRAHFVRPMMTFATPRGVRARGTIKIALGNGNPE